MDLVEAFYRHGFTEKCEELSSTVSITTLSQSGNRALLLRDSMKFVISETQRVLSKRNNRIDAVGGWDRSGGVMVGALLGAGIVNAGFVVVSNFSRHKHPREIEGNFKAGINVIVVETDIGNGKDTFHLCKRIERLGGHVDCIISAYDPELGAHRWVRGYDYFPLVRWSDMVVKAKKDVEEADRDREADMRADRTLWS